MLIFLDNDLVHGSSLEAEYTFTIENTGTIPCTKYTITDVLDPEFTYKGESKLLSEDATNTDKGWNLSDDGKYVNLTSPDNTSIAPGEKREIKLKLSALLSAYDSDDAKHYENSIEKATFTFENGGILDKTGIKAIDAVVSPRFGKKKTHYIEIYILCILISSIIFIYFIKK